MINCIETDSSWLALPAPNHLAKWIGTASLKSHKRKQNVRGKACYKQQQQQQQSL
jgi:hypothetical protein